MCSEFFILSVPRGDRISNKTWFVAMLHQAQYRLQHADMCLHAGHHDLAFAEALERLHNGSIIGAREMSLVEDFIVLQQCSQIGDGWSDFFRTMLAGKDRNIQLAGSSDQGAVRLDRLAVVRDRRAGRAARAQLPGAGRARRRSCRG